MDNQPPHPRIVSAYPKESPATQKVLAALHNRSYSLPATPVRIRPVFNQTPRGFVADIPAPGAACSKPTSKKYTAHYDTVLRCRDLDALPLVASKSRQAPEMEDGGIFNEPSEQLVSAVDKMVAASWGGGRKKCLKTLLSTKGRLCTDLTSTSKDKRLAQIDTPAVSRPSFQNAGGHWEPGLSLGGVLKSDGRELGSEPAVLTPSLSRFPLPPAGSPLKKLCDLEMVVPIHMKSYRNRCSSLFSAFPQSVYSRDSFDLVQFEGRGEMNGNAGMKETAPLVIRKKTAQHGPAYSSPETSLVRETRKPDSTQEVHIQEQPSAGDRRFRKRVALHDGKLESVPYRAMKCPPGIRDPYNRI